VIWLCFGLLVYAGAFMMGSGVLAIFLTLISVASVYVYFRYKQIDRWVQTLIDEYTNSVAYGQFRQDESGFDARQDAALKRQLGLDRLAA
jgi:hypothetical protein